MKRPVAGKIAAAVIAAAGLALSACTGTSAVSQTQNSSFSFSSGTPLGKLYPQADRKKAENFTGSLLGGGTYSLASAKGKIVVVNFWATWCPPCVIETPQFALLYNKIKSQGVDFVGIDTKDDAGQAKTFVADNHITYPIVFDQPGKTAIELGNLPQASLPFTVLIDRQGKVAAVYEFRLSDKDLQTAIDKLQAER